MCLVFPCASRDPGPPRKYPAGLLEWKRQALRFWSALTALPETSIFKQAVMDDLAAAQQSNTQNWAAGLLACATRHGMALTGAAVVLLSKTAFS